MVGVGRRLALSPMPAACARPPLRCCLGAARRRRRLRCGMWLRCVRGCTAAICGATRGRHVARRRSGCGGCSRARLAGRPRCLASTPTCLPLPRSRCSPIHHPPPGPASAPRSADPSAQLPAVQPAQPARPAAHLAQPAPQSRQVGDTPLGARSRSPHPLTPALLRPSLPPPQSIPRIQLPRARSPRPRACAPRPPPRSGSVTIGDSLLIDVLPVGVVTPVSWCGGDVRHGGGPRRQRSAPLLPRCCPAAVP